MDASKPSRTAEYMALFRALETARPARGRLFRDPWAVRFLSPGLRLAALVARLPLVGGVVARVIDWRWPGPRPSGVVRTALIDEQVSAALDEGCTQLVLLGAGYDTRGLRLPAAARVTTWEVDHPSTQARKRALVGSAGARIAYVPVDFEHDELGASMERAGFPAGERCCVVWEGVLSYLTLAAIDATLGWIVGACAPGSRLVLTYVDGAALDGADAAWISAVRDAGEPFVTGIEPEQAASFFAARGLRLRSDASTRETAQELLGAAGARRIPPLYRVATLDVAD